MTAAVVNAVKLFLIVQIVRKQEMNASIVELTDISMERTVLSVLSKLNSVIFVILMLVSVLDVKTHIILTVPNAYLALIWTTANSVILALTVSSVKTPTLPNQGNASLVLNYKTAATYVQTNKFAQTANKASI